ncbi:hypothetical protein KIN20_021395 [Parelaphostrongylus tenuis]|uniref:Uncharacterized protein n=1 Tax=Parelaphostrongylus tenuis TaxID=148309 RepID=A0AAD5QUH4_PARTN|nr:hypothetical protein KIN20_021395 [Parelaphostrongylus tenuis]
MLRTIKIKLLQLTQLRRRIKKIFLSEVMWILFVETPRDIHQHNTTLHAKICKLNLMKSSRKSPQDSLIDVLEQRIGLQKQYSTVERCSLD